MMLNSLRAKVVRRNINIYFNIDSISLFHIEMTQEFETLLSYTSDRECRQG